MGSVSLDQFVVTADQRVWHGEAKRFGGLELDDPVRLPPGRLRLVTSPAATGSALFGTHRAHIREQLRER